MQPSVDAKLGTVEWRVDVEWMWMDGRTDGWAGTIFKAHASKGEAILHGEYGVNTLRTPD